VQICARTRLSLSKSKAVPLHAKQAQRGGIGIALPILDHGAITGVGGKGHEPAALPPGKRPDTLYRKLGGNSGRSGWVRKMSRHRGSNPELFSP
jgi:hypothetical protein